MAKKIRFALEMDDGVEVRTLEELKSHFSVAKVIEYLKDGKLITWLRDRYCDELAEKLAAIDFEDLNYPREVCELFGVEYNDGIREGLEIENERLARIEKLREYTEDKDLLKHIDNVAFDQDELYDLLDEEQTEIYLCGERFSIPTSKEGITYIGINHPVAVIDSDIEVDWKEKSIVLRDVVFDEKYQIILDSKKREKESDLAQSDHNEDDSFANVVAGEEIDFDDLTEENITSITQIKARETKEFKNMRIHISAFIKCRGAIIIDHCVLYYNESEVRGGITLADGASIIVKNSQVICKGFDKKHFITCTGENGIVFENTTFVDCACLIEAKNAEQFRMEKCVLKNCYAGFAEIDEETGCEILGNQIVQDCLNQFYVTNIKDFRSNNIHLLRLSSANKTVKFHDNTVYEKASWLSNLEKREAEEYKLDYLCCDYAEVYDCHFDGITSPITASSIKTCEFKDCKGAITAPFFEKMTIVEKCVFKDSTDVIRTRDNTQIMYCSFTGCYDNIIYAEGRNGGVKVECCQFNNIKNSLKENDAYDLLGERFYCCIFFRRSKEYSSCENIMKECIFDGIEMEYNFLIAADGYEQPAGDVAVIEECQFANCSTKRSSKKLIKQHIDYFTVFKKRKDFLAIKIRDCSGIDSEGRVKRSRR